MHVWCNPALTESSRHPQSLHDGSHKPSIAGELQAQQQQYNATQSARFSQVASRGPRQTGRTKGCLRLNSIKRAMPNMTMMELVIQ